MRSQAGAADGATLPASRLISSVFVWPFYLFIFIELQRVRSSSQTGGFHFFWFICQSVCLFQQACSHLVCVVVFVFIVLSFSVCASLLLFFFFHMCVSIGTCVCVCVYGSFLLLL